MSVILLLTAQQKLKLKVSNKHFLDFFENPHDEVKLKSDTHRAKLDKLLEVVVDMVNDPGIVIISHFIVFVVISILSTIFNCFILREKVRRVGVRGSSEVVSDYYSTQRKVRRGK